MLKCFIVFVVALCATAAFSQEAKIKVGDRLKMTCEEEPTLNKEYTVTQQGVILVDFIGAVHVEGNTETEAAKVVSARLTDERILRRATITVKIVRTNIDPITYRGAVQSTGQEQFKDGLRLSDIVKKAKPRGDTDLGRIEVRSQDGQVEYVDFTKFEPATNANNPVLRPGDTVTFTVKSAPRLVVLLGGIERPGGVTWEQGMTVRSAIAKAGGFASRGVNTTVRLERQGQSAVTLDLSKLNTDAPVREGDRIIVAMRENLLYVTVSGAVVKGGFIEHSSGMTLTNALKAGGGLRPDANPNKIKLTRNGQSKATEYVYADLIAGRATDPVLAPGDKVMVDAKSRKKTDVLKSLAMLVLLYILIGQ